MSNLIQESPEEHFDPFDSRFSTLCLNPSAVDGGSHHPPLCSSCSRRPPRSAATPLKRRSPTPFQHPTATATAKKLFLDHHHQQQHNPSSFSKIDLPCSLSPLRRSVSLPTEHRIFSPPWPSNPPPPLRRTVSDPHPSPDETPFKISRVNDSIKEDSPDSKRLRRIKDRLKEMNQWWNEVMSEEENRDVGNENDTDKKSGCCKEEEDEETVGVERVGDSLELRLKCPCGKGFEILLNGRSCFYKLL